MLGKLHLYIPIQRHLKAFFLIMYGLIISRTQQKIKQFFANLRKICLIFELFKWCWIILGEFRHYLCVDIKIINPNLPSIRETFGFINNGDPYGNRTHVTAVKGRCLSLLTNGP